MKRHLIKTITLCGLCIFATVLFAGCGEKKDGPYAGQELHVYNWGEYEGEYLLEDFEDLTGCTVIQDEFDSNESMYIKIANGDSYDVIVPSDYMIERLLQEDLLQPLDKSRLTGLEYLTEECLGLPYDPDNDYSVPYFWGTVGLVYDTNIVDPADLEAEGYNILLDTKYKGQIYLYDSERDMFMVALKALGYSMNSDDPEEINEAYEWLLQCVRTMEPEIVVDEVIDNMAQGRKALAVMYSGDATYVQVENTDMDMFLPETGTNLWSDAMCIPKSATNVPLAHEFINYVCDYEAALDNTLYVGYTSPNKDVVEDVTGPGGEFSGIDTYVPRAGNQNDEVFAYNPETRKLLAELWSRVKVAASNVQ